MNEVRDSNRWSRNLEWLSSSFASWRHRWHLRDLNVSEGPPRTVWCPFAGPPSCSRRRWIQRKIADSCSDSSAILYRFCHRFRLGKRDDYFWVDLGDREVCSSVFSFIRLSPVHFGYCSSQPKKMLPTSKMVKRDFEKCFGLKRHNLRQKWFTILD